MFPPHKVFNSNKCESSWIIPAAGFLLLLIGLAMWSNYQRKREKELREEFVITYGPKISHPWRNTGSTTGFIVNGVEGPTLNLKRGIPYKFTYASPPGQYPFYFTKSEMGGEGFTISDPKKRQRIPGSPILGESESPLDLTTVTVIFDNHYPSTFYYQSTNYPRMGGIIHLS